MTSKRLELGLNLGRGIDYHAHLTNHGLDTGWAITLHEGQVYAEPHGTPRTRVDVQSLGQRTWRSIAVMAEHTLGKYPTERVRKPSLSDRRAICIAQKKSG